ncbi:MAG: histidine phosphatase family protein [Kineosporiaceae bacterium]
MRRTLLLYRHADASRPPATADVDRDLSDRGERQARAAGRWLLAEGLLPDLVVVSPSVRTTRTWALTGEVVAREGNVPGRQTGVAPAVVVEPAVYAGGVEELSEIVHDLPPDVATALICGHEPGLSEVLCHLAGEGSAPGELDRLAARGMRKGSVAVLVADDLAHWRAARPGGLRLVRVSPVG